MSNIDKVSAALSEWLFNVAANILPNFSIPSESPIGKFMYGILGVNPANYNIWKELGFLAEPTIQVMISPMLTKFLGAVPDEQIKEITEKLGELLAQRDGINKDLVDLETQKNLKLSDIEKIGEQIESFKARRRELEPQLEETKATLEEAGVNVNEYLSHVS